MENKCILKKMAMIAAAVSLAALVGCSNQFAELSKSSATTSSTESQPNVKIKDPEKTVASEKPQPEKTQEESHVKIKEETQEKVQDETSDGMKKEGTPEYGYIKVPNDWIRFHDVDGNDSYQVCKGPSEIISLNVMHGDPAATIQDYAYSVGANLEAEGGQDIKGANVKIGNYDALQVFSNFYNGEYFVVAWIFQAEDGKYHYIAAEGSKDVIQEAVGYVEKGGWSAN